MASQISFKIDAADRDLIFKVADRAAALGLDRDDRFAFVMDLTAANANGCPMDFPALLAADDFNFIHDIAGIARHINRDTGKLMDCFCPRFARREVAAA